MATAVVSNGGIHIAPKVTARQLYSNNTPIMCRLIDHQIKVKVEVEESASL